MECFLKLKSGQKHSLPNFLLSIPYPDLIAKGMEQIEKPYLVEYLLFQLGPERQSREIAEVALRKAPGSIRFLASPFCTPEFCQKVLEKKPELFCTINAVKRTPELSLFAVLLDKSLYSYVPMVIKKGENIFSFGWELIKKGKHSFTLDEIKKQYPFYTASQKESPDHRIPKKKNEKKNRLR